MEVGRARLDKLQAKSSSVYLCLTWEDPILAAFYLIEQAEALAFDEPIFKVATNIHKQILMKFMTNFKIKEMDFTAP